MYVRNCGSDVLLYYLDKGKLHTPKPHLDETPFSCPVGREEGQNVGPKRYASVFIAVTDFFMTVSDQPSDLFSYLPLGVALSKIDWK